MSKNAFRLEAMQRVREKCTNKSQVHLCEIPVHHVEPAKEEQVSHPPSLPPAPPPHFSPDMERKNNFVKFLKRISSSKRRLSSKKALNEEKPPAQDSDEVYEPSPPALLPLVSNSDPSKRILIKALTIRFDNPHLQPAVLSEVFCFLPFPQVLACCTVCTAWNLSNSQHPFWSVYCRETVQPSNYLDALWTFLARPTPCEPGYFQLLREAEIAKQIAEKRDRIINCERELKSVDGLIQTLTKRAMKASVDGLKKEETSKLNSLLEQHVILLQQLQRLRGPAPPSSFEEEKDSPISSTSGALYFHQDSPEGDEELFLPYAIIASDSKRTYGKSTIPRSPQSEDKEYEMVFLPGFEEVLVERSEVEGFSLLQPSKREEDHVNRLQRVLFALWTRNREVGYCQGQNFLAALLLRFVESESKAFWIMDRVLMSRKYRMGEMYAPGLQLVAVCFYQLHRLLTLFLPNLSIRLASLSISSDMFSPGWFLTLFSSLTTFPLEYASHIFSWFLACGWPVIFKIVLALLLHLKPALLKMNFSDLLSTLHSPVDLPPLVNLVRSASEFPITQELLDALEEESKVHSTPFAPVDRE